MAAGSFRFERFVLDEEERQLRRDGVPVDLNARYLDALALLVREQGKLVSKDRFLEEVWRGVPVTDEALTQCVKTLRRQLGDAAGKPRFIETVPKHGYRFIAPVEPVGDQPFFETASTAAPTQTHYSWREFLLLGSAGMLGGGAAGVLGGLLYGFAGASEPSQAGVGAVSVLLVLVCLTVLVALVGGAGVGFGIAAAGFARSRLWFWSIAGGAFAKLLGLDAFNLLFGQSPGDITGAAEGALIGGAIGLGAWLGGRGAHSAPLARAVAPAALAGGAAGILIALLGGRLLGGSLDLLARQFPNSRLRLDHIGSAFGESGFGTVSQAVTGAIEGILFGGCVVGAMILARRSLTGNG